MLKCFLDRYKTQEIRDKAADALDWFVKSKGHSKSTFAQDSCVLTHPLPPCSLLFIFEHHHPLPKVRLFWLEITLSPSISIRVKFREKKLMMSTSILTELNKSF